MRKRTDLEITEVANGFIVKVLSNYSRGEMTDTGSINVFSDPGGLASFIDNFYSEEVEEVDNG